MTCYKQKLNLRQTVFGLAHEWRKSLELNLRQRPGGDNEAPRHMLHGSPDDSLQFGADLETIRAALTRDHDGSPALDASHDGAPY